MLQPVRNDRSGVNRYCQANAETTVTIEAMACGLAVLGHTFSPFLRFRGGKGVATGAGAFAVLSPRATLVALVVFVVVLALSRIVGLGSVLAALSLPVATHLLRDERSVITVAWVVSLVVVARHRANIVRILRGRESRLRSGGPT